MISEQNMQLENSGYRNISIFADPGSRDTVLYYHITNHSLSPKLIDSNIIFIVFVDTWCNLKTESNNCM